ncbi:hypothetical protein [Frigoribacterium faeni]|uniref:Uncharacterized protein n=1 Tax=Frigoribacterium faeni TaxID=145483 RepID=A0A7W3JJF0_9MICO|nr:hypothetical protein [Frigoribacterium faeni]MBA8813871.1 hypothetical protein [Frigoribacterium faeni]BFF15195.1 hypothetical protein GCM10025699_64980 [Microbacterium flavescens]GEK82153.1 hypothetical protein FFA01_04620 [Frigoribacterium faeni]
MTNILTAIGSIVLLLVSFALFAYSFGSGEPNAIIFFAGIVAMTGSFWLPITVVGNSHKTW